MPRLPRTFALRITHDDQTATIFKLRLADTPANNILDARVALHRHLSSISLQYDTSWRALAAYTESDWNDIGYTFCDEDLDDLDIIDVGVWQRPHPVDLERTYRVFFTGSIGVDATSEDGARIAAKRILLNEGLDLDRFESDLYFAEPTIARRYRVHIQLETLVSVIDNHVKAESDDVAHDIAALHPGLERFRFERIERTLSQYRQKNGIYVGTKCE